MDCGVPFCHNGCPLGNVIPDWNDLVYRGRWKEAIDALHATNNFPEFTGRICPAPCEEACVLSINDDPVTIKLIEKNVIDQAWKRGFVAPAARAASKTGKKVAVVGSGPAGLACAQQLARAGHDVTVFERADRIGGLLRYGIPDFKMEKHHIDRRMEQMEAEGVTFRAGVNVGTRHLGRRAAQATSTPSCWRSAPPSRATCRCPAASSTASTSRWSSCPSRTSASRATRSTPATLTAEGKHVIVIGGGDTGSDCIGTSNRHGAKSVTQLEILPQAARKRARRRACRGPTGR